MYYFNNCFSHLTRSILFPGGDFSGGSASVPTASSRFPEPAPRGPEANPAPARKFQRESPQDRLQALQKNRPATAPEPPARPKPRPAVEAARPEEEARSGRARNKLFAKQAERDRYARDAGDRKR